MQTNKSLVNTAHKAMPGWVVALLMLPFMLFEMLWLLHLAGFFFVSLADIYIVASCFAAIVASVLVFFGGKKEAFNAEYLSKISSAVCVDFERFVYGAAAKAAAGVQRLISSFVAKSIIKDCLKLLAVVKAVIGAIAETLTPKLLPIPFAARA